MLALSAGICYTLFSELEVFNFSGGLKMDKDTLTTYLKTVGMRHNSVMEFWADLMNESKGQITGWLVENGYKDINQLKQYLRLSQIVAIGRAIMFLSFWAFMSLC